ncbi:Luc7-related [Babesia duncani]|uniref:Luc7-related n=1 Tax=Babesia duncani TaxID=323732 RepID=A0AAD9UN98_9APIC|nr:Luc7-related [Babesia duncani]
MDDIRAQWAQLMGEYTSEQAQRKPLSCHDATVCKMYLCGICPHDLFENTKHYLGECSKVHSESLRLEYVYKAVDISRYLKHRHEQYYGYEAETLRQILPLIAECDRRIAKGKARAQDDKKDRKVTDVAVIDEARRIDAEIFKHMSMADELGTRGEIEASYRQLELIEALKKNKLEMLEKAGDVCYQQKLKPCDVCGALLSGKLLSILLM